MYNYMYIVNTGGHKMTVKKEIELKYPEVKKDVPNSQEGKVFKKLMEFTENPKKNNFSLEDLYNNLREEDLSFALKMIMKFFKEETYLMKENENLFLIDQNEPDELYSISSSVDLLKESGLNFYKQKINTYLERGRFPEPDTIISGRKFWNKRTLMKYIEENK